MTADAQAVSTASLALVVFGRDESGKAHGSAFNETDAELATKAASLMGMRALPIRTDDEQALAAKLPRGRVFASGRAFVPFIKMALLAELQAAAGPNGAEPLTIVAGSHARPEGPPEAKEAASQPDADADRGKQPKGWGDLGVGAIVLAATAPKFHEWYECLVIGKSAKDVFTMRYCDWPNQPPFDRCRDEIALLHPAYTPDPPLDPEAELKVV